MHKFCQNYFRFLSSISLSDQPDVKIFLFTLSAVTAPITAHLHTAGFTAFSEFGLVSVLVFDRVSPTVIQVKMYRLSLKVHTRLSCLLQELHPIVMTGPCTVIILTVAEDLLNLPGFKIVSHTDLTDEWSAHHALVFEREFKQYWDALVCTPLVFGCHIKKDVIPAVTPTIFM